MSFIWWVDNETAVPIYYGMFLIVEENGIIDFAVRWMEPEEIILNVLTETQRNKTTCSATEVLTLVDTVEAPYSKSSDGNYNLV